MCLGIETESLKQHNTVILSFVSLPPCPSCRCISPPTYMLGVRCQPQLTDMEVLTISTFAPIRSYPPGPRVTEWGARGCHQPLIQKWGRAWAAQLGSRWSLVQVRAGTQQSLFFWQILEAAQENMWKKKRTRAETPHNTESTKKKKNTKLSQANKSTKSCSCSPDRLTQLPPLFTLCFPFFWFLRRIILEELLFLWPLIDNAMTNAGLRLKFKKKNPLEFGDIDWQRSRKRVVMNNAC